MKIHRIAGLEETRNLDNSSLRERFLLSNLFRHGQANYTYAELDRAVVGGICPGDKTIQIDTAKALRAEYFFERREAGILNVGGGTAIAEVDGERFELQTEECLYIGRGSREVFLSSMDPEVGAMLYFVSFPAHAEYPTRKAALNDAREVHLGDSKTANERVIYQYIHQEGLQSCQLVMGFTKILSGSVWNTMPPHTHERRCELYFYFNLSDEDVVFHIMGEPENTKHLVVRNQEVVLSPPWSIHAGCGTNGYNFVWAMGGENQRFDDMDLAEVSQLK